MGKTNRQVKKEQKRKEREKRQRKATNMKAEQLQKINQNVVNNLLNGNKLDLDLESVEYIKTPDITKWFVEHGFTTSFSALANMEDHLSKPPKAPKYPFTLLMGSYLNAFYVQLDSEYATVKFNRLMAEQHREERYYCLNRFLRSNLTCEELLEILIDGIWNESYYTKALPEGVLEKQNGFLVYTISTNRCFAAAGTLTIPKIRIAANKDELAQQASSEDNAYSNLYTFGIPDRRKDDPIDSVDILYINNVDVIPQTDICPEEDVAMIRALRSCRLNRCDWSDKDIYKTFNMRNLLRSGYIEGYDSLPLQKCPIFTKPVNITDLFPDEHSKTVFVNALFANMRLSAMKPLIQKTRREDSTFKCLPGCNGCVMSTTIGILQIGENLERSLLMHRSFLRKEDEDDDSVLLDDDLK